MHAIELLLDGHEQVALLFERVRAQARVSDKCSRSWHSASIGFLSRTCTLTLKDKVGMEACAVIRGAMNKKKMVGIGRVVMARENSGRWRTSQGTRASAT